MTPFFFGPMAHRLYGVYHAPEAPNGGVIQVLLCPPFGQEAVRLHRLYRLLAEQLSRQGAHVMRFDYFGTGESSGTDEEATLAQWRTDVSLAHHELSLRTRASQTVWLGARLGATMAIQASADGKATPDRMVLWEPILDGQAYLEELGHAHVKEVFDPYVQTECPSAEVSQEVIGFGVGSTWLQEVNALSVAQLAPRTTQGGVSISADMSTSLSQLVDRMRSQQQPWQHLAEPIARMAWHSEEANGAALAPPDLLRLLISSVMGTARD